MMLRAVKIPLIALVMILWIQACAAPQQMAKVETVEQRKARAAQLFADLSRELEAKATVDPAWLSEKLRAIAALDADLAPVRFNLAILAQDSSAGRAEIHDLAEDAFTPALENQAAELVDDGKIAAAMEIYESIVAAEPKNVTSRLSLARLLLARQDYPRVIVLCRQALQRQADASEAFRILAQSYQALGNLPMAQLIIARGLKIKPDDIELHHILADVLLQQGELLGGVAKLKQVIALDGARLSARAELAAIALKYRDYSNAAQQYEAILKMRKGDRAATLGLAVAYGGLGRFEQAEKEYRGLLADNDHDVDAAWNLASLYHRRLARYDDAIAMYQVVSSSARAADVNALQVPKLVSEVEKLKLDQAQAAERAEHERKRQAAVEETCRLSAQGQAVNPESIGNEQERIESAWQVFGSGQNALQSNDLVSGEAAILCSFKIVPATPRGATEACAPMHVAWAQLLYQLDRAKDALATIGEALRCDPNNPDAQLIEQQLKELLK